MKTLILWLSVLDSSLLGASGNGDTDIGQTLTGPWLDFNSGAAPDVLLHLRHALSGRLV